MNHPQGGAAAAAPISAAGDVILEIGVQVSLEVGRTTMSIRQLLQLNTGSVIELDRPAGDQLDVLVNGRLVAHGEVVMVNDRYGVRFTDAMARGESRR
ncbi:flagellar motor switch protein FliN [bacterium]|nr:MAG: flagellar motor switch protein FliN [bacterium]